MKTAKIKARKSSTTDVDVFESAREDSALSLPLGNDKQTKIIIDKRNEKLGSLAMMLVIVRGKKRWLS